MFFRKVNMEVVGVLSKASVQKPHKVKNWGQHPLILLARSKFGKRREGAIVGKEFR